MKGRLRPASAVYPFHSWAGELNFRRAIKVAVPSKALVGVVEEVFLTICAFCLRTSAGVRMRQETSSPVEEARAWATGVGRGVWFSRRDLLPS